MKYTEQVEKNTAFSGQNMPVSESVGELFNCVHVESVQRIVNQRWQPRATTQARSSCAGPRFWRVAPKGKDGQQEEADCSEDCDENVRLRLAKPVRIQEAAEARRGQLDGHNLRPELLRRKGHRDDNGDPGRLCEVASLAYLYSAHVLPAGRLRSR